MNTLERVVRGAAFAGEGIHVCRDSGFWCVVVDPVRHPLAVCRYTPGRGPAHPDAPAVWTNGPLMGKHLVLGRKATRNQVLTEVAGGGALAAGAALAATSRRGGNRSAPTRVATVVAATGAGVVLSACHSLTGWEPCGAIRSAGLGVDRDASFDGEGPRHAWIARTGDTFDGHRIGQGDPPRCVEGMGGLLRIVRDGAVPATRPGAAGYDPELARLGSARGVAAWALVPLAGSTPVAGVIVVAAAADATPVDAGAFLAGLGARDAVATDMSRSAFAGVGSRYLVGPPWWPRRMIQPFGLCCA